MAGTGKTEKQYILPEPLDFQQLRREISRKFTILSSPAADAVYTYFDTFDWRLYRKRLALVREGDRLLLLDLEQGLPYSHAKWAGQDPPRFCWQIPKGDLRSLLEAPLDVRALLPLMIVTAQKRGLRILNQDQKTVLRLDLSTYDAEAGSGRRHRVFRLEPRPVLGYGPEFKEFKEFLRDLDIVAENESLPIVLMRQLGLEPGEYTSKFLLPLEPELPSGEAVRRILRHLIGVMARNEEGVKADKDTEFLHDYRVAIRRIRSALGQLKGIFPEEETSRFREDFARLGQATNALRDLDVYLLKREEYQALLPDHLATGLDALFEDLAAERKKELRAVSRSLNSAAYHRTVALWTEFLDSPADISDKESPRARQPVFQLACRFIFRRYRQVLRAGEKIRDDSPDEELHRLRINCKKLRYLLEFFASLFPEKEVASAIGQLKKLQDNLGDFNDLFVQQRYLEDYLDKLEGDTGRMRLSAAAVGGLIASLDRRQKTVRQAFNRRFRAFSSPRSQARFEQLFKPSPGGKKGR